MAGRSTTEAESVSSISAHLIAQRRKWSLTQEAFESLLAALGDDRDEAATKYLELHRNLVGSSSGAEDVKEELNQIAE